MKIRGKGGLLLAPSNQSLPYNDRRKFSRSCTWDAFSALNLWITPTASCRRFSVVPLSTTTVGTLVSFPCEVACVPFQTIWSTLIS